MSASCWTRLGLPATATVLQVEAAWRTLRSAAHPDKGGDPGDFERLKEAYEEAYHLAATRDPDPCGPCGGTGKITVVNGFASATLACEACGGTGKEEA